MFELIPIVMGLILGVLIWRNTQGRLRLLLSVAAVALSGATATMLSGETPKAGSLFYSISVKLRSGLPSAL